MRIRAATAKQQHIENQNGRSIHRGSFNPIGRVSQDRTRAVRIKGVLRPILLVVAQHFGP
jgi:hypothetical protein